MKKELNSKKLFSALIVISLIIAMIIVIVAKITNNDEGEEKISQSSADSASDFENLQPKDIELKYNEENDITYVSYKIQNTSEQEVTAQTINVTALNEDDNIMFQVQIYIDVLAAKEEYSGNYEIDGNFTEIVKKLKLEKPVVAGSEENQDTEQKPEE